MNTRHPREILHFPAYIDAFSCSPASVTPRIHLSNLVQFRGGCVKMTSAPASILGLNMSGVSVSGLHTPQMAMSWSISPALEPTAQACSLPRVGEGGVGGKGLRAPMRTNQPTSQTIPYAIFRRGSAAGDPWGQAAMLN